MKKTVFASLLVLFVGAVVVVSCNDNNKSTTPPAASFGVVNASPDAGSLDVYVNNGLLVRGLAPGADTGYFTVAPGTYTLSFADSGSTTLQSQPVSFAPGVGYSVFAIDSVSHLQAAVVIDSAAVPTGDSVEARFLNFSPNAPALDLAINGTVVFSGRSYNDVAANPTAAHFTYLTPGTYTLELRVAGTSVVLYSTSVTTTGGKIYTFFAKGFTGDSGAEALSIGTVVHNQ